MAKTSVAKTKGPQLPAGLDMEADSAAHQQHFTPNMLLIPRLAILQDLSPEVRPGYPEYIDGARPGLIMNQLVRSLDESVVFAPSKFFVRYIAWQPRSKGGGLVDPNLTLEDCEQNFEQDGIGSWTGMMRPRPGEDHVRVEIKETPEWVGIAKGAVWGPMPVAISFPSTKVKAARLINTTINLTEVDGKNGRFTPAPFYHTFTLRTALEERGQDKWFGYTVAHDGLALNEDMIVRARDLAIAFDNREAKVDDSGLVQ